MHKSNDDINHNIRIWRTNTMFNYWHSNFDSSDYENFIASIDYKINKDAVIIDNLVINDKEFSEKKDNKRFLSDIKAKNIIKSLLEYIKHVAKEENKIKIILSNFYNTKSYNKYYKNESFELTKI